MSDEADDQGVLQGDGGIAPGGDDADLGDAEEAEGEGPEAAEGEAGQAAAADRVTLTQQQIQQTGHKLGPLEENPRKP